MDVGTGSYVKVGRVVTVNGNCKVGTVNATGAATITGLPFTVGDTVASTGVEANGPIGYYANMGAVVNSMVVLAGGGTTVLEMYGNFTTSGMNASAVALTNTQVNDDSEFRFSLSYFT